MTMNREYIIKKHKSLLEDFELAKFSLETFVNEYKDVIENNNPEKTRLPPKQNFANKRAEHMYYDLKIGDTVAVKTRSGIRAMKVLQLPEVYHVKCKVPEFTIFRYNQIIKKWIQTFIENKPEDQVACNYSYNSITGKIYKNDRGKIEVKRYK